MSANEFKTELRAFVEELSKKDVDHVEEIIDLERELEDTLNTYF